VSTAYQVRRRWLQSLPDPDVVNRLVGPDPPTARLNTDNPELKKIAVDRGTWHGRRRFSTNLSG